MLGASEMLAWGGEAGILGGGYETGQRLFSDQQLLSGLSGFVLPDSCYLQSWAALDDTLLYVSRC